MKYFTIDTENNNAACDSCCCPRVAVSVGEDDDVSVDFYAWSGPIAPLGLEKNFVFDVELIKTAGAPGEPANVDKDFTTQINITLNGSLATDASDNEGDALTYSAVALYGPDKGILSVNPTTGAFTYVPNLGCVGYDEFWFETSDGISEPVRNRVTLRINDPALAPLPPHADRVSNLYADQRCVRVVDMHTLAFSYKVSPAARVGEVYRLKWRQPAIDCDLKRKHKVSCLDFEVRKC